MRVGSCTSADAVETLLVELASENAETLVRAILRAGDGWKRGVIAGAFADEVLRALLPHAKHVRAKVRQAVAEAAMHLPDDAFESIIADLLQDPNAFVKQDAVRTYDERSRRRRAVEGREEIASGIQEQRDKIAARFGKSGVRAAEQLCRLVEEHRSQRLHHELDKVTVQLTNAVGAQRALARRADADRMQLTAGADEIDTLVGLTLGILKSMRTHARVPVASFRPEKVRPFVEEQVALLRGGIGDARRARLRVEIDVDDALVVDADRGLLAQAFANILQNAVEAYPSDEAGGDASAIEIRIRAEPLKAGTLVAIVFEDRGRGIAADALAHIGEPFVSSKGVGRGLGVGNVRKMIEGVHGGTMEIASEVGVGTRVRVVLPRKQV